MGLKNVDKGQQYQWTQSLGRDYQIWTTGWI